MHRGIPVSLLAFVMWHVFLELASTSIFNGPVDTEVMVGDSTYMNCSTSDPSREIHWYHYPVGSETKDHEYVYVYGHMHPPYDKRFRIDKDNSSGSFNLVVTNVELQDSGLYVCQNDRGSGQWISAQLVVLDGSPTCDTNIKPDGFIGPNSCGLTPDKVQLSCGVNYHGNIPPVLKWNVDGKETQVSSSELLCEISDTRTTCNVTLNTTIGMDGSSFVCQTSKAAQEQYKCTTDEVNVLFAIGDKEPVEKTIGDEVTCSANTNSPKCSYNWIWFDGFSEQIVSKDHNLKVERQGWHRCEANCAIKESQCTIVSKIVKGSSAPGPAAAVNDSTIGVVIAVVVTFTLCLIIAAIPGCLVWRKLNGKVLELRNHVEELQDKDYQWKAEKKEIQDQLKLVTKLTATILEEQGQGPNQTDGNELKRSLGQLISMISKALRNISDSPSNRVESPHSKFYFDLSLGSLSNGKMKKEMETSSKQNYEEKKSSLISAPKEGRDIRTESLLRANNRDEDSLLISSRYNI